MISNNGSKERINEINDILSREITENSIVSMLDSTINPTILKTSEMKLNTITKYHIKKRITYLKSIYEKLKSSSNNRDKQTSAISGIPTKTTFNFSFVILIFPQITI